MIAVGSNSLVKAGVAFFGAGRAYALPLLAIFSGATAAGLGVAVALRAVTGVEQ